MENMDKGSGEKESKSSNIDHISSNIGNSFQSRELPTGYTIEIATEKDIEDIERVRKESRKETYTALGEDFIENRFVEKYGENSARLQRNIPQKPHYILLHEGKIVGIKYPPLYDKDRAMHRIGAIYILKEHHNKGLGTALMQKSLAGVNEDLILGVEKNNTNAIQFYKKMGFVEDPSLEHDYVLDENHTMRTIWLKKEKSLQ